MNCILKNLQFFKKTLSYFFQIYFAIRGGSRKKIAKKMIPKVPIKRKVYTNASIYVSISLNK